MNKERLMFPGVMYVKDRSNRTVTTVGQKNKLESPTEFKLYLRNVKHSWGRVLYTERQRHFRIARPFTGFMCDWTG